MRTVVLLCGPPGAGKTTTARSSGLPVYDRDDPQWQGEQHFTRALARLAHAPNAQAVVIRSGATSSARARAAALVGATHVYVLTADRAELRRRVRHRDRHDLVATRAGIDKWFERFDAADGVTPFPGWDRIREPDLGLTSTD